MLKNDESPGQPRPDKKCASDMFVALTVNAAVSTTAPGPNTTPLGLIRNTRPFEVSCPRILEMSGPTTRFSTTLAADCCWNCVSWPAPIEKPCQLMIEFGELVTLTW